MSGIKTTTQNYADKARKPSRRGISRRTFVIGCIFGALIGILLFGAYAILSSFICLGLPECPRSWQPYVIILAVGTIFATLIGGGIGWMLHQIYRFLNVD